MHLSDLTISRKIGLAVGILMVGTACLGLTMSNEMRHLETVRDTYARHDALLAGLSDMRLLVTRQESAMRGYMVTQDGTYSSLAKRHFETFGDLLKRLRALSAEDPSLLLQLERLETAMTAWQENVVLPVLAAAGNEATYADALFLVKGGPFAKYMDALDRLVDETRAREEQEVQGLSVLDGEAVMRLRLILLGGAGVLLASLFGLGILLSRSIAGPASRLKDATASLASGDDDALAPSAARRDEIGAIAGNIEAYRSRIDAQIAALADTATARRPDPAESEARSQAEIRQLAEVESFIEAVDQGVERLSRGDLTTRLDQALPARFEPIRQKFNTGLEALEDTMGRMIESIGSIRVGLNQIHVASGDLSQKTEGQAASLQQTTVALSEVTRRVAVTAEGASQAQNAATSALKNAELSGQVVARAVAAMSQIEDSSEKIGRILGVIDEIAFQTNLLALNAGVEAARAGEAGRGFAVVAQEVRTLAQRSADAGREIKQLISASRLQVGQGVELVTASGRSLDEIVEQVADMSRIVTQIAGSARDQATNLRDVSTAADQMDKVTQQNAAMVEQTTAAAAALTSDTLELAQLVMRFRTRVTDEYRARSRRVAPLHPPRGDVRTARAADAMIQMRTPAQGGMPNAAAARFAEESWDEF